jgi:deltex
VFEISYFHTVEFTLAGSKMEEEKCMICLEEFVIKDIEKECAEEKEDDILMLGCSHKYHRHCLLMLIGEKQWAKCPICSTIFGHMTGDQPDGKMKVDIDKNLTCLGHPKGTIIITYSFHSNHRNGKAYTGTTRVAYLPNTPEGNEVLALLKEAFDRRLTFTIGRSVTTGLDNQVVWNGIHHKTSVTGGASHFGFPDPTYLTRVKEELAFKGIVKK